ncbi:hypothetical protein B2J88_20980 [Rhodococcus sp. SRB_17]|nr:DUF2474 domain-containing protein [Acidovorax sp. SRB_24]NMM77694.1 hypothetical protein [Acidovorax sp. SRB_24]NMM86812.1 hypothetical protein [Rhodococcus sp. SRB_17]
MATGTTETRTRVWLRRLTWLVLIWLASVAALFLVASALRYLMAAVGFSA